LTAGGSILENRAIAPAVFDGREGSPSVAPLFFDIRANVYIDGVNLYYGACKGTPNRWLDLRELCRRSIRPGDDLYRICYFTADIRGDQAKVIRQQL